MKMSVLREVAKKHPNGHLDYIIKTVDEAWNREIQKVKKEFELKNKSESKKIAFVTKF